MRDLLPWMVLCSPFVAAVINVLILGRVRVFAATLSVLACAGSLAGSIALFVLPDVNPPAFAWLVLPGLIEAPIGLLLDDLSKLMLLVVTGIGLLVHVYSLGYMRTDAGKSRYFAGLSLFMFSMLGIVLADNFFMMFIFWELVGVSSYVLIGHWFTKRSAADAAKKAFIINRIGDFGYLLGILMLWGTAGTVAFSELFREDQLAALAANPIYLGAATLLIFCGAIGKSAQAPLHVWLPDAMEGPTPVSALIHAATMVAAGVYMLARSFPLVAASPEFVATTILWIGLVTSVIAALMALQQNDIKRILAYSTLSQLGYMVMTVGLLAPHTAMFHLYTHAFFKALLFLGAGAIIHALHHEQDIWKMGGLIAKLPVTFATFVIGSLALMGVPGLSGYFSKHEILAEAHHAGPLVFWLVGVVALLTCFYMTRLVLAVFVGKPRSSHAQHAREVEPVMAAPLILLAVCSVVAGYSWVLGLFHYFAHGPEHEKAGSLVDMVSYGAIGLGVALATLLYGGREREPFGVRLLSERLYIDHFYDTLVRTVHEPLARLCGWFDRWVIDAVLVRGIALLAWSGGFALRLLQFGSLQVYALLFGVGVVGVLFLLILR